MKRVITTIIIFLLVSLSLFARGRREESVINLWTQEGTSEGAYDFVVSLTEAYMADNEGVMIEVLNKETEALREDFQNASLAGDPPQLLWTVNDHAGPFVTADLIRPLDEYFDFDLYVDSVVLNEQTYGVPISSGNHLMLLYNRDIIDNAPSSTDELLAMGDDLSQQDVWTIVWNQIEPFWLVPWLGGFGGTVFAEDGVSPTLNTRAMVQALDFLAELKEHDLTPPETDYDGADTLFKEGKAAMIVNGDWSLGDYRNTLGSSLGVARLPQISATGQYPAPYTSGKYFMVPQDIDDEMLATVIDFIAFATSYDNQIALVETLTRLPGLRAALNDQAVVSDALLKGSSEQISFGTPMPSVIEMRCNWDAMKPELNAVLSGQKSPSDAASAMQSSAEACIREL